MDYQKRNLNKIIRMGRRWSYCWCWH